ncbi:GNAT family N-acetyltransferase [Brevibacillus choshinensis]|uniref:GNAT family N-acetyltransferase n=1 Tax=Brevibacillus choshinensis TaxID=54911 RepID=UPI002E1AC70E|nr:GNAT family N-acetyltransferase [Brevibacillus choshinensis]MED4753198.1 GNAT family N-acetyltransferase [Brevibacillus choshinensis]
MSESYPITIRDAHAGDRELLEKHLIEAYQQYEQKLSAKRWEMYKEEMKKSVAGERTFAFLVAGFGDEIVGSVQLFASSEAAYGKPELAIDSPIIRFLAVSPRARGKGIAVQLIRESIQRSLAVGASTLHLHTTDMMETAVKLYERLGFERAVDKDFFNGEATVKSYRLRLNKENGLVLSIGAQ